MKEIVISTPRLKLVPISPVYLDSTNEYALDKETTKYMINLPNESSEETLKFLQFAEEEWRKEEQTVFEFAVICDGVHIGSVDVTIDNEIGELGWILNRMFQGKGYAFEAASALIRYFTDKGITHFIAHCDTENTASYSLMEKLGMKRTAEYGGRKNRGAENLSREYLYEIKIE